MTGLVTAGIATIMVGTVATLMVTLAAGGRGRRREIVRGVFRLVTADLRMLDAALVGDDALAPAIGYDVVAGWATFSEALGPTRDALAAAPEGDAWGARFFLSGDPAELVGWGGFKGAPADGVVELGYEIAAGRRGRGLATAAVQAMLAEAFADRDVSAVIAHTLAERNASTRVLEKTVFAYDCQAREEGEVVWRFRLERPGSA